MCIGAVQFPRSAKAATASVYRDDSFRSDSCESNTETFWGALAKEAAATGDSLMSVKLDLERITSLFTKMVDPTASAASRPARDGKATCHIGGASLSASESRSSCPASSNSSSTFDSTGADIRNLPDLTSRTPSILDRVDKILLKPLLPKPVLIPHQRATNIGICVAKLKVKCSTVIS